MEQNNATTQAQYTTGTTATLTYKHPATGNTMTHEVEVVENSHNLQHTDVNEVKLQYETTKVRRATITESGTLRLTNSRETHRTDEWELTNVECPEDDGEGDEQTTEFEPGTPVEIVGDNSHYNLGNEWEVLTNLNSGEIVIAEDKGVDTLTVTPNELEIKP